MTAMAVAGMMLPKNLLAMQKDKIIGIQLYTIRDLVAENLEGTLETLSNIGYKSVEAAGYDNRRFYNLLPGEYKKVVEGYGLMPLSSHSNFSLEEASTVIEDTQEAGMKYLVIPWLPEEKRKTLDDYKILADEFNKIGELCKSAGLTFGYHNHDFEFKKIDNVVPYNVLLENTEPDFVSFQLDLYWIIYAGFRPTDYFKSFPGRFKTWHVKDMDGSNESETTEVGKGIINFQSIFKKKELAGMEYCFVEQEHFKTDDKMYSVKTSFNYLDALPAY
jgi:sugar phosphate isomerase/epimerase